MKWWNAIKEFFAQPDPFDVDTKIPEGTGPIPSSLFILTKEEHEAMTREEEECRNGSKH